MSVPSASLALPPAGWLPDGSGRQRWWTGTAWSEVHEDPAIPAPASGVGVLAPAPLPTSKSKIVLVAISCAIFSILSLIFIPANPVMGILGFLLFGVAGFFAVRRHLANPAGLTLRDDGIHIGTGGVVPWGDLEVVRVARVPGGPLGTKVIAARLSSYEHYVHSLSASEVALLMRTARVGRVAGFALAAANPTEPGDGLTIAGVPQDGVSSILAWSRAKSGFDLMWSPLLFVGRAKDVAARIETYRVAALTR
jgi:hypothetical protein